MGEPPSERPSPYVKHCSLFNLAKWIDDITYPPLSPSENGYYSRKRDLLAISLTAFLVLTINFALRIFQLSVHISSQQQLLGELLCTFSPHLSPGFRMLTRETLHLLGAPLEGAKANQKPPSADGSLSQGLAHGNCWRFSNAGWRKFIFMKSIECEINSDNLWSPCWAWEFWDTKFYCRN